MSGDSAWAKYKNDILADVGPMEVDENGATFVDKDGEEVTKKNKLTKWAPLELNNRRRRKRSGKLNAPKVRKSLQPGTVVIILHGKWKAKRAIVLKAYNQIGQSGFCLVTGPYSVNKVPITRVAQKFLIATKTCVDLAKFNLPEELEKESFFKKAASRMPEKSSEDFLEGEDAKRPQPKTTEEYKKVQAKIDAQLVPIVEGVPHLKEYLATRFTLMRNQHPHKMVF
mmetsp:Transcript_18311/g.20357  ORF Transcript_18311/g.20357 Transcript_18311/m.20357 type:complete len:226 (+) Transcript_18311:64-741(+)